MNTIYIDRIPLNCLKQKTYEITENNNKTLNQLFIRITIANIFTLLLNIISEINDIINI